MRDFNRIDPFCKELIDLWKKCPDMRFGQLIVNALGKDPFYIEDHVAIKKIRAFVLSLEEVAPCKTT